MKNLDPLTLALIGAAGLIVLSASRRAPATATNTRTSPTLAFGGDPTRVFSGGLSGRILWGGTTLRRDASIMRADDPYRYAGYVGGAEGE